MSNFEGPTVVVFIDNGSLMIEYCSVSAGASGAMIHASPLVTRITHRNSSFLDKIYGKFTFGFVNLGATIVVCTGSWT